MPQARRMTNPTTQGQASEEALAQVRDALDNASTFEEFQDALTIPDEALPDLENVKDWPVDKINANWEAVSVAMAAPNHAAPASLDNGPLSIERVRKMTPTEINARWSEVQAVLGRAA